MQPTFDDQGNGPVVYWFNPLAEGRIALGVAFTPVKHQAALARDLANLPQFLCRPKDTVLIDRLPTPHFLGSLKAAGFAPPEFLELSDGCLPLDSGLMNRKLEGLRPWAWGPDSVDLLQPLFAPVAGQNRPAERCFNERIAELYSKEWSAEFLRDFLQTRAAEPWICTLEEVGTAARSLDEALALIRAIRGRGHHKVVVKEAIGLAGHNAIRLWEPELLAAQRRWMSSAFDRQATVVIEPWLEREFDFSIQLEMEPDGLRLCGYTVLTNDRKGQYQANSAAPGWGRGPPAALAAFFRSSADFTGRLQQLYEAMFQRVETALTSAGYLGPLGIDAFAYRTGGGEYRVKPIAEINPRFTMGRVTLELMNRVCPGCQGTFRLVNRALARDEGFKDFSEYAANLAERFPVRLEGGLVPKIKSGALPLNDPARAEVCLAVFRVEPGD